MDYRVPVRAPKFRVRNTEPIAFDGRTTTVYKLNDTAYRILRLVDGTNDERSIALKCVDEDVELAEKFLPKCRAYLEQCVAAGLLRWA